MATPFRSPGGLHRLSEIVDIPQPSAEEAARAAAAGAEIVAYDPNRVRQFVLGHITLGDLEGISKEEQYDMAKIGYAFLEQNELDRALDMFRGLVALDPYDAYFHTALGAIAQRQERLEDAEKHYTRALEINPFSATALANRGEVRLQLGRLVEGAEDLVRAVQEDPQGREPATRRAQSLAEAVRTQLQTQ